MLRQLLPALARVFALPAQQLQPKSSSAVQGQGAEDLQRQLLVVQLEALHVLLLLLPLPQAAMADAGPAGRGARWPAQLRQGLGLLLRGRISAVQRHSALQLAAAVVDLAGPGWLLGDSGEGPGANDSTGAAAGAAEGEAFFQLLVEVTKVETSVLLHDALAPSVPVPLAAAAAPVAGGGRAPAPRATRAPSEAGSSEAGDGDHAAGAALAADLADVDASGASADVEPLLRVLASEQDRKELEEQLRKEQREAQRQAPQPGEHMRRVDETPIPAGRCRCLAVGWLPLTLLCTLPFKCCRTAHLSACPTCSCLPPAHPNRPHPDCPPSEMRWEGPSEASGARAARVLPSCFALLEACVEALAADTQVGGAAWGRGRRVAGVTRGGALFMVQPWPASGLACSQPRCHSPPAL